MSGYTTAPLKDNEIKNKIECDICGEPATRRFLPTNPAHWILYGCDEHDEGE